MRCTKSKGTIVSDFGCSGPVGLTLGKLGQAQVLLFEENVDLINSDIRIHVSLVQYTDLENQASIGRASYSDTGMLQHIAGFRIVLDNELGLDGDENRIVRALGPINEDEYCEIPILCAER